MIAFIVAGGIMIIILSIVVILLFIFAKPNNFYGEDDYGFKQHDFVVMHFGGIEEGHVAWLDFGEPDRLGDRLYLVPLENSLLKKWPQGALFPIYDKYRLENCTMATPKENKKIKKGLYRMYRPTYAEQHYRAWLKRLEEIENGKTN